MGSGSLRASDQWLPGVARLEKGDRLPKEKVGVHRGREGQVPKGERRGGRFPRGELGRSRGETRRAPGGPEGGGCGGPRGRETGVLEEDPWGGSPGVPEARHRPQ